MNNTVPTFSDSQILDALQHHYQLTGILKTLPSYADQNLLLACEDGQQYVVKVANTSELKTELDMQNAAMTCLLEHQIPVPEVIKNQQHQGISELVDSQGVTFHLRVLTFLPGDFYAQTDSHTHGAALWNNFGLMLGKVSCALSDFNHPGAYRFFDWDLAHGYRICQTKKDLLDAEQVPLVEYFLEQYQAKISPLLSQLPKSVIHNDANDHNVLVDDKVRPTAITGIIDFGDMVYTHSINELAIAAAYALMGQDDPEETLAHMVAGYHQIRALSELEFEALYYLIALRLCTTVCNAAKAIKEQPDNDYLLVSVKPAWALLHKLKRLNGFAVCCRLKSACGLNPDSGRAKQDIIAFRKKHLGKTLSLSFKQPLKIVRGEGAYLFDEAGNRYLDMVNNVCHVGHCHPKVVAAGQMQMARLNTNTRFLHDNLVNYADKLLATMPDSLSVVMLVNSGSEANELAFRLAKNFTGSEHILTVDGAYHGHTNACINASSYKFDGPGGEGAKDYVHKVMLPDPYRGPYQGMGLASGQAYAEDVQRAIDELDQEGLKPGLFICESLQGVAGQIIMPEGYLPAVYEKVRAAGGVCIADEVQVGFGRVGSHMWAFETQNVVPDIVTLGKPIGNGHPMAAVITTQAIADAFVTGMEYFNTFGGNPVSCAIGSAVLDVIESEKLRENAQQTGDYFLAELRRLQQNVEMIGDVRGMGLFIGVELVTDRETKAPATQQTAQLCEFLKERQQIILSTEGPFHNVLKIKPPIVFNRDDVDRFVQGLSLAFEFIQGQTCKG